jgi:hypothetical protein
VIDPGEYELERSGEPVTLPPPRSTTYLPWVVAIVAALAVAGGVWYVTSRKQPPPLTAVNAPTAQQPTATPPAEGPLVQAADIDLPPLPQTDPIVRELVARLSSHPTIAAWLATDRLIENFTVVTLNIAEGRTPTRFLQPIAPRRPFRTVGSGEELFVDSRSYERYNAHADAIAALDAAGTASLYLTLKPRISDAYRELGNPEGDFDRVLERAIGVLLQTPVLDDKVAIHPVKGVAYAYDDPKLESLSPAQKQLLRMGPRNARAVRAKLQEIAALLKLQPESR